MRPDRGTTYAAAAREAAPPAGACPAHALERCARLAAIAGPLTHTLLGQALIVPGMDAIVVDACAGDLAFLTAERVGSGGGVVAIETDPALLAVVAARSIEQRFANVGVSRVSLEAFEPARTVDAVICRFALRTRDAARTLIARAARWVRPGGRVIVQDWHFASLRWSDEAGPTALPLVRQCATWACDALTASGAPLNLAFELSHAFAAAGLPVPALHVELRPVSGRRHPGYRFFADLLTSLAPVLEQHAIAAPRDVQLETLAARLEREVIGADTHTFLPMQVGAWTCVP